ncbi:MAG: hypothetical protein M5U09_20415 [Gammaproteobacteria bacterium]|nr:hypothetical protein [Gammaproteobacteria bacterium]
MHCNFVPILANRQLAEMFGYEDPDEILALPDCSLLFDESELERVRQYNAERLAGESPPSFYRVVGKRRDGRPHDSREPRVHHPVGQPAGRVRHVQRHHRPTRHGSASAPGPAARRHRTAHRRRRPRLQQPADGDPRQLGAARRAPWTRPACAGSPKPPAGRHAAAQSSPTGC